MTDKLKNAINYLNENKVTGTPVVDNKNKYLGIITIKDIAKELLTGNFDKINTSYDNILNTINAIEVLKFDEEIKGNILIPTYRSTTFYNNIELTEDDILIVGDRHSIIEQAVNSKVKLIILTSDSQIKEEHIQIAKENKVNIIRTSNDSYRTSKIISFSNYIKTILTMDESKVFKENDYYDYFIEETKKLKHNNYPILNNKNECLGLIRVTEIVKKNNKRVMLVDHQEKEQSVDGLEEAQIIEIVDHHKIGNINTNNPINFRNMNVGSTNTIIYFMYDENNVAIPKDIAGLMLSGILSDTLCLQSPTTTSLDINVVKNLCRITQIDYKEFALQMFKAGTSLEGLKIEDVIKNDFKSYPIGDKKIAVAQLFTLDKDRIFENQDEYIKKLEEISEKEGFEFIVLVVTDILENGSYLLFTKNAKKILELAYNIDDIKQTHYVDKLVSRKKQILPMILEQII